MSDGPLVAQVLKALAAIPHTPADCFPGYEGHPCTCDREERIAQRVAAAIEGASEHVFRAVAPEGVAMGDLARARQEAREWALELLGAGLAP